MIAATAGFETFGASHLTMIVLFFVGLVPAALLGRRVRGTERENPVSRGYAVVCLAVMVPLQAIDFLPRHFDLQTTLPLQLCDVALVATVVALWTRRPVAVALSYYWGLTLTTQALVTPALASDFPHPKFLAFWAMHLLVVWAAVYLVWGLGVRPRWRTYATTIGITAVWLVCVYVFNSVAGTNYGFVNGKPDTASALDLLGPWPWYLLVEVVLVAAVWALMTWPWTGGRTGRRPSDRRPAPVSG